MQQAYKSHCLTVGNAISLIFIGKFEFTKSSRSVGNERTLCRYSIQRENMTLRQLLKMRLS